MPATAAAILAFACLLAAAPAMADAPRLEKPFGMTITPDGVLLVADIDAGVIHRFNLDLQPLEPITDIGGVGPLRRPFDVAFDGEHYYILETGRSRVVVADADWNLVRAIGSGAPGSEPGQFSEPHFLAVDADRNLYVTDTLNQRVQIFDPHGDVLRVIGCEAVGGPLPLKAPSGIDVLAGGRIVVADYSDHPPIIVDRDGNVLQTLAGCGMAYAVAVRDDRAHVVCTYGNTLLVQSLAGDVALRIASPRDSAEPGGLNKPGGVAVDDEGNIYINEWRNHRIQKFDRDGHLLATYGGRDTNMDQTFAAHPRLRGDRPVILSAFTRLLSPDAVRTYYEAGVRKLYLQTYDDVRADALRVAIETAHELGMRADFVFNTYQHGAPDSDFARETPRFFTRKRDGTTPNREVLSYVYPEVRTWKVREIIDALKRSGADGVVLDYIRWPAGNTDGYDPPAVERFEQLYGVSAFDVPATDPRWAHLRSSYITAFLMELRDAVDAMDRKVTVGVYVDADPEAEMQAVGRDWPTWGRMGLVDATHHMIYTDDFDLLYDGVRTARTRNGGVEAVACIDVYAGYLSTPRLLKRGAQVATRAGADEVVIVRDGAIERLKMFPAMRDIARMFETHQ